MFRLFLWQLVFGPLSVELDIYVSVYCSFPVSCLMQNLLQNQAWDIPISFFRIPFIWRTSLLSKITYNDNQYNFYTGCRKSKAFWIVNDSFIKVTLPPSAYHFHHLKKLDCGDPFIIFHGKTQHKLWTTYKTRTLIMNNITMTFRKKNCKSEKLITCKVNNTHKYFALIKMVN